ncbi:MAG TPA: glycogen/starch synthase [Gemmatimonadales bacterium]|nr:glycogen/starch synthase [Gemmatimonadales bacterium]
MKRAARTRRRATHRRALEPLPGGATIVHLTAEYMPFARTGGLGEAVRGLAEFQAGAKLPVTVILPLHRQVRERRTSLVPVAQPLSVDIAGRVEYAQLYRATGSESQCAVFFVDNAHYFDRAGIYGEGADYPDSARRFAFFCRAALAALSIVAPNAGVLHAHDWHAALSIIYLRQLLAGQSAFDRIGTVLTVHNGAFQGHFPPDVLPDIGLSPALYHPDVMEWYGRANVLKGGLKFCDCATTVSPTHAAELRTAVGGFGLHDAFAELGDRFVGIRNGIDDLTWDPSRDPLLPAPFHSTSVTGKAECKAATLKEYGLSCGMTVPLFVMSARLVEQKGIDLIIADDFLLSTPAQFVFLGRGEGRYESALASLARQAPDRIAVPLTFTDDAEHRLLAGADALLMPCLYEPCGLTQMRAQMYGTLPVVRRVGGLADTVEDGQTGFMFDEYTPAAFRAAVDRAIATYANRRAWRAMMRRAMIRDFSWGPSAVEYHQLYRRAMARRAAPA